jgi:hypothetical protein
VKLGRRVKPLAGRVKVGTRGFEMHRQEYYRTFPVVEIQQMVYRLPRPTEEKRWRPRPPFDSGTPRGEQWQGEGANDRCRAMTSGRLWPSDRGRR